MRVKGRRTEEGPISWSRSMMVGEEVRCQVVGDVLVQCGLDYTQQCNIGRDRSLFRVARHRKGQREGDQNGAEGVSEVSPEDKLQRADSGQSGESLGPRNLVERKQTLQKEAGQPIPRLLLELALSMVKASTHGFHFTLHESNIL